MALRSLLESRLFLAFVGFGAILNVALGLYKGYVAPADIMQDIVSAQEYLHGRPMYPPNMTKLIQDAVAEEPATIALSDWFPALRQPEEEALQRTVTRHWVQAHPPLMTLVFVPLVAAFGVHGTFLAITGFSLAALLLCLHLLGEHFASDLTPRQKAAISFTVLGWAPVVDTLRAGQPSILLGTLVILGWWSLRRSQQVLAGILVALATCLKLYPGLLFVYLLVRYRRAFAAACVAAGTLGLLAVLASGWSSIVAYRTGIDPIIARYAVFATNVSLLGVLARLIVPLALAQGLASLIAVVTVGFTAWLVYSRSTGSKRQSGSGDVEYALFVALMPILSPIAWHHYLVILLLPFAVLMQRLTRGLVAMLGCFAILSLPEAAFPWLNESLSGHIGKMATNLTVISLHDFALWGLWILLVSTFLVGNTAQSSGYTSKGYGDGIDS
jgi:Glycosyltransferase family 87